MTEKFGWCLTGQHADDPEVPEYSRCPGRQWTLTCPCECHENPLPTQWTPVHAAPPVSATFTQKEKPAPAAPKKRQRRKLL